MIVTSFAPAGFDGDLVHVEVDVRRGIPAVDIVGLPDSAVREARERIRVAVRNSGFEFPRDRVLVNLAPADVPKRGSLYDLPIAIAVLGAAGLVASPLRTRVMILGELELSGRVRAVRGVLSAVATGIAAGVDHFVVPLENAREARAIGGVTACGVSSLRHAVTALKRGLSGEQSEASAPSASLGSGSLSGNESRRQDGALGDCGDFADMRGNDTLKRAIMASVCGRHHLLLFGPPGSGKTMAASRIPSIMPKLTRSEALEVTRVHSIAGVLDRESGVVRFPPFRAPHHTASNEGLVGGGSSVQPGEISLAHRGVLFLDEAPEFSKSIIQSLREPLESGQVFIVRAGARYRFPSDFLLVLAANPCPCGNMGRDDGVCICSKFEVQKYWKRVGGPLLDRIDLRFPVTPVSTLELLGGEGLSSAQMGACVAEAVNVQARRYADEPFSRNGLVPPGLIHRFFRLSGELSDLLVLAARRLSLSSRACHSIIRVARSLADIDRSEAIEKQHVAEAVELRRYGDSDYHWRAG